MKNIISTCMTIIFLCFSVFLLLTIFKWKLDSKHTKEVIMEIKNIIENTDKKQYTMDLTNLINYNEDTIGYIIVYGTLIEYPIVKTNNNSFYLNHSFDKKYNDAGWVFMDYRNNSYEDKNIVLYAHDRKDNTMFGTLKYTLNKDWQNNTNNHIITIYTKDSTKYYQVFSTYHIKNEDYYITTDFSNISFKDFINTLKKRSNYKYNINVNESDNILTLSTCYTAKEKVVLHAKLLK